MSFVTLCLAGAALAAAMGPPPRPQTGFLDRTLGEGASARRYQVFVPASWDPSRSWPVILFLHGSGERGRDGIRPTAVGLGSAIRFHSDWFPAIVVFPQAPDGTRWSGPVAEEALRILDAAVTEFHGDRERVSLVGISMGGRGALEIAAASPERFSAVVAVCGWVVPPREVAQLETPSASDGPGAYAAMAKALAGTRLRLYHGADDPVVPVGESRRLAAALTAIGADAVYTEFPGVGHGSWDPAFDDAALWRWVLSSRRGRTASAR